MLILDAHCDTILYILEHKDGLYSNNCSVDISRALKAGSWVQFFAIFVHPVHCRGREMLRAVQLIDKIVEEAAINTDTMSICLNYENIQKAVQEKKLAAIISMEGGEPLQGDIAALRAFYKLGVRCIGLTWNYRNEIADGIIDRIAGGGLTPFGRNVVQEMNKLGMIVDVSHLSEKGFWDVIELSGAPIIASHSNAAAICNHPRNLSDEQLLAIKKNGGVTGINLCPDFLNQTGNANVEDIVKHIEHIAAVTGEDCIGLGTDFDGIEVSPEGVDGVQDIYKIFDRLLSLNYQEEFIKKFAGENFLRVIREVL